MNNYIYIVASLPDLSTDWKASDSENENSLMEFIRENLSEKDLGYMNDLLDGFVDENLNKEFYERMLKSKNKFLRDYFLYDLNLRNYKVEFINKSLGRDLNQDIFLRYDEEYEPLEQIKEIFNQKDLYLREKAIDDLTWKYIDELMIVEDFSLDVILAFIVKLHIVYRWLKLDVEKGKELFKQLVSEIRSTYKGVEEETKELEEESKEEINKEII